MGQAFLMGQSGGKVDFSKLKPLQIFSQNIVWTGGSGSSFDPLEVFPAQYVGRIYLTHSAS